LATVETVGINTLAESLATALKLPEKAKFWGVTDSPMPAEVLATTMRETLDGEVVTAITVIDKAKLVAPPLFCAVTV
jgi:hypothetical protein